MTQLHAAFGDALLKAHRALLEEMQGLEPERTAAEQPTAFIARLDRMRANLAEHFRFEEQNGYLDSILERHPHLERAVARLQVEHRDLLRALDEIRDAARSSATVTDDLRDRALQWTKKVRRHEQSENVLVEDAFNIDLAAED
jgi:hypothetical protein